MPENCKVAVQKAEVLLRSCVSLFIGGACFALVNFLTDAQAHIDRIDWHRLTISACVGGALAVAMHFATPPNQPK